MCQNAFFPCLQEIIMCRSKREEQKTDVWSDKKRFYPEFRKISDARLYRVQKKESKILSNFNQIQVSKKQALLKIVLTCNTANYKDIQHNYFLFIFEISQSMMDQQEKK